MPLPEDHASDPAAIPDLPASFVLPDLPPELDAWFRFAAARDEDTEVISFGSLLDDLGVVDAESARFALAGYRWTIEAGEWIDEVARGGWRESWIVLDSVNADPIIADLSGPGIPVLADEHGRDAWDPQPLAATLAEYIAGLDVNQVPGPPPFDDDDPLPSWSVWATDLGPEPLKTLVALAKWPLFDSFTRPEIIALSKAAGPVLLASDLTESGARSCVDFAARQGATLEARED